MLMLMLTLQCTTLLNLLVLDIINFYYDDVCLATL